MEESGNEIDELGVAGSRKGPELLPGTRAKANPGDFAMGGSVESQTHPVAPDYLALTAEEVVVHRADRPACAF